MVNMRPRGPGAPPSKGRRRGGGRAGAAGLFLLGVAAAGCCLLPAVPSDTATGPTVSGVVPAGAELANDGHVGAVRCLSFAPHGPWLLSGSSDGGLFVWDVETKQIVKRMSVGGSVVGCAFLPDGRRFVAASSSGELSVWDSTKAGAPGAAEAASRALPCGGPRARLDAFALRDDGREVLAHAPDGAGTVFGCDVETGALTFGPTSLATPPRQYLPRSVGYLANGVRYLVAAESGEIVFWGDAGGELGRSKVSATSLAPLPDGRLLAGNLGGSVGLLTPGRPGLAPLASLGDLPPLAVNPRGDLFLLGNATGRASVHAAKGGESLCTLPRVAGPLVGAFEAEGGPDHDRIALAGSDGDVLIVRAADCRGGVTLPRRGAGRRRITAVAAGENTIYLGDSTGDVLSFDPEVSTFGPPQHALDAPIKQLAILPGGRWLAVGEYAGASLMGRKLGNFYSQPDLPIYPIAGGRVAINSPGHELEVYSACNDRVTHRGDLPTTSAEGFRPNAYAIRPGSDEVVAGGEGPMLARGSLSAGGPQPWRPVADPSPVTALAYSLDGRLLAEGHAHGKLALRDADTGEVRRLIETDRFSDVTQIAFTQAHVWAAGAVSVKRWALEGDARSDAELRGVNIKGIAATAGGRALAVAADRGAVVLGAPDTRQRSAMLEKMAAVVTMRDGSWVALFPDGHRYVASARGDALGLLLEKPDRTTVRLDGTPLPVRFGGASTSRRGAGAFEVRATVLSPAGPPTVMLDGRFPVDAVRPSASVGMAYDVELLLDDPDGGGHFLEAHSPGFAPARAELSLGPDLRRARALFVGNEAYDRVARATGAGRDADELASVLGGAESWGLSPDRSDIQHDLRLADLRGKIASFFGDARPGETLLFYFAGHGRAGRGAALLPRDFDPANPDAAYSADELWRAIRSSKASNVLLVFDACRAGGFAMPTDLLAPLLEAGGGGAGPRVGLLAAASASADSQGGEGGGAFSRRLVKVLRAASSADGWTNTLSVMGAFRELLNDPRVRGQSPRLLGALDDLFLARPARPIASTRRQTQAGAPGAWLREARYDVQDLRLVAVEGRRVDGLGADRNLIVTLFFGHDTERLRVTIRYPDPDPSKGIRLQKFAPGGQAETSHEIAFTLKREDFAASGEYTVIVEACNGSGLDACQGEPAQRFTVRL